jgi:hypothetical protein
MDINQFKKGVADLKEIVSAQTQVRTNKLKPYIELFEEAANYLETAAPAPKKVDADIAKENKYLKRKLTMYDLKIAKLEDEVKKWKKLAKGNKKAQNE